ncbi:cysteine-rich receptor-like protein kinase 26 [Pistacia vera]|uniref:cysteine-rich receptor-like protein kinase 26 n=1 Tax=Pistacia vera TaxID=55513 RepID=UPI00126391B9|nr:cysteine-rich receptor-like protein kinase 26 [Pistacia vera]
MAIRTNQSNSIFLEPSEAQDFINVLGKEKYSSFRSDCQGLSEENYSDDACFNCVVSFRESLKILEEKTRDNSERKECGEALLLSLVSSDVNSPNWVPGTFSCLWNEIRSPLRLQNPGKSYGKNGFLLGSEKLLIIIIVAAALVLVAPILYKLTRKQLRNSRQEDIDNLSVPALKKKLEDESRSPFICSDLCIFSPEEMEKATNFFNHKNLIGEVSIGKVYMGVMANGMRLAIKRLNEEKYKLQNMTDEIYRKAKMRHPNLVSTLGYCDRGDLYVCLV